MTGLLFFFKVPFKIELSHLFSSHLKDSFQLVLATPVTGISLKKISFHCIEMLSDNKRTNLIDDTTAHVFTLTEVFVQ